MSGKLHALKIWPEFYFPVVEGAKPFEVRFNDRDYQVGDDLLLKAFDLERQAFIPHLRPIRARISYVMKYAEFGVLPGFAVLGLKDVRA